ncbi:MAG: hypothetical protein ABR582_16010 [Gemmatimonadaceae bacterium]
MLSPNQSRLAAVAKSVPILGLLFALVAGVFAWQQSQRARDLANRSASLTAELRDKNAAMQERAALIDRLRQENDSFLKESASLREQRTTRPAAPQESAKSDSSLSSADKNKVEFAAKTLDDPRGREALRRKQSAVFKQIYGDFIKDSHLSDEQVERFLNLFLDEDMRQFDEGTNFFNGNGNSREADAKEWATRKAELDKQLKELLGENGFAKWETYEKTTGERQIMVDLREQIAIGSTPLRDDQAQALLQILLEERARAPSTLFDPAAREDPREKFRRLLEGNNADVYYQEEKNFHQRVLGRAGTLLDPEQYEAMQDFQNQYVEVARAGIEMLRATMASKKK